MKIFTITIFLALFAVAYSWTSRGVQTDPAHPGKCVVGDLILSPGEEGKPKDRCLRIMCTSAEGDTVTHGCGTTKVDPPCVVGKQKYPDEPYPKCCEMEIICPEGVQPTRIIRTG